MVAVRNIMAISMRIIPSTCVRYYILLNHTSQNILRNNPIDLHKRAHEQCTRELVAQRLNFVDNARRCQKCQTHKHTHTTYKCLHWKCVNARWLFPCSRKKRRSRSKYCPKINVHILIVCWLSNNILLSTRRHCCACRSDCVRPPKP